MALRTVCRNFKDLCIETAYNSVFRVYRVVLMLFDALVTTNDRMTIFLAVVTTFQIFYSLSVTAHDGNDVFPQCFTISQWSLSWQIQIIGM